MEKQEDRRLLKMFNLQDVIELAVWLAEDSGFDFTEVTFGIKKFFMGQALAILKLEQLAQS